MAVRVVATLLVVLVVWSQSAPAVSTDVRLADATQAKATGGMIALFPRPEDARALAVAGGEPAGDLHLTLVDFGPDVTGRSDAELASRLRDLIARWATEVKAGVFGHATFSPGTPGECAVYLVGDSPHLAELRDAVTEVVAQVYPLPPQHVPWIPHITAGYRITDDVLAYTGGVVFDRIGLRWAGHATDIPLHPTA
ncbi:2'-5' RNA ligase family protein [Mycolicibacterium sp. XJ1904]